MAKRSKPKAKDAPYDSLTGRGGERLAQEVYYYTNCATAAEFAEWWKRNQTSIAKPMKAVRVTVTYEVPNDR